MCVAMHLSLILPSPALKQLLCSPLFFSPPSPAIFPIVATTWLAFLVFFLPRKDMEARLGAVTGLFLALAAIQFVITGMTPASSYVTAMQQLVLTSYVTLIVVGLENVLLWWLTNYHKEKERCAAAAGIEKETANRHKA